MNQTRLLFRIFVFALLTFAVTSLAQAQATRTWVSGVGDDVNLCNRTAPCKTFAGAISKTAAGGEISTFDAGGFGAVTITKPITIDGTGNISSILAAQTTGIIVNIADAKEPKPVRIRGLTINGAGNGRHGINVIAGAKVFVEDTAIDGFTGNDINVEAGQVFANNTSISNCANAGINLAATGAQVGLSQVKLVFNGTGVAGPMTAVSAFDGVVLYGNKTGDPTSRR